MTFVKYNENGTIVLQPAALMFSGLDSSDLLELHLLDHTMVLLDTEMTVTEGADAALLLRDYYIVAHISLLVHQRLVKAL